MANSSSATDLVSFHLCNPPADHRATLSNMPDRKLGKFAQNMRQCQNCFISEVEAKGGLRVCGSCKRAHYCSPECQKKDWKLHKMTCKSNTEQLTRQKEQDKISAELGTPSPVSRNLRLDLKAWVQIHRPVLMSSAIHGLDLIRTPENMSTCCLSIELVYRANDDQAKRFLVKEVFLLPLEELFEGMAREKGLGDVIADFKRKHELARKAGGLGLACVFLRCGPVAQMCPYGISEPLDGLPIMENWEENLRHCTSHGKRL